MHRLLFALILFASADAAGASSANAGSVSGIVINDADRQPVRKAAVILTSLSQDRSYAVAITDGTGRYTLPGIPAGRYRLSAVRDGFLSVSYGATKPQRPGTSLNLAAAEQRTAVTLHLIPSQSVSGTVLDAEGDPLPGIQVSLYTRRMDRGKPHYLPSLSSMTDQQGHYQLSGNILPGQYWALAHGRFMPALRTRPVAIIGETLQPETVTPQFYSHADRLSAATPIIVSQGRDVPNVDFQLNYSPQINVHGTIGGIPENSTRGFLRLEPDANPINDRSSGPVQTIDPANPAFRFNGLIPGPYRLVVQMGGRRAIYPVTLSSPDTELNVSLLPGTSLSGSVTVEGPAAEQVKNLRISLSPGEGGGSRFSLEARAKSRTFTFEEIPAGIWDINVAPLPRGAYIKSMRLGQQDVLLEDMEIGPNTKGPLTIVISMAAPKVEGTLDTAASATVLAAPTGSLAHVFSFYSTTQADEKGHFKFEGLNPGSYRFYAFQEVEPEAWQDPAFLLPFEAQSKPLELKEGATETLTLAVIGSAGQ